ncbi:MAG: 2-carboxy-1,4-naphthoquinone phytyltransferase, partial [Microcystaceae cyanobacterium]
MTTVSLSSPNPKKLWMAAIKPPMYSVAVIPIAVGTSVAYGLCHQFQVTIFAIFMGAAIAIVAWLNLSNDVFDADTGIDQNKAHSVVNLTGNKTLVFGISNLFLMLGLTGIIAISWLQKDWTVLALILTACFLGYTYQGPPFRLGYQGLGEIICFFTFGPLALTAVYYSQAQQFNWLSLMPSILIGISTATILFCSHFHQVKDDLAAGKRSR